ncbi:glycosyltransferase family 4 protein [Sphingobacterium sp. Mn56C]|uniref:glycosyltransferase family 4 protein n=1 Tax=Sphingobacterium sp. Mn56C TaxID=3395261 RepID=UPI003BE6B06D
MMKIVYCILGTFNSGGMERVLANKVNYLSKMGYQMSIITTDQKGRSPYFALDAKVEQYDLGINYTDNHNLGILKKILSHRRKQRVHQERLTTLLLTLKADIVISMFDHDGEFLYRIADGSRKLMEIHFSRFKRMQYGKKGIQGWINKWRSNNDLKIAKKYEKFVVLTEEDSGYWGDLPNMRVIPNANSFHTENRSALQGKHAIAIGRLDHQKNFEELLAIWSAIYSKFPDWRLSIYGHGPDEEKLQQQIKSYNLADVVFLKKPTTGIQEVYLQSDLLLMTSRYEGLPMVLLEAQVCGLPLIAYACKCGPKDIIESGKNGFVIAEGDRAEYIAKLTSLLQDMDLRKKMGAHSKLASQRFEESVVMEKWISLFQNPQS